MYMYVYNVHVSIIGIIVEERRGISKRWGSLREGVKKRERERERERERGRLKMHL